MDQLCEILVLSYMGEIIISTSTRSLLVGQDKNNLGFLATPLCVCGCAYVVCAAKALLLLIHRLLLLSLFVGFLWFVMRGSRKFCQRVSNFDKCFFQFMRGEMIQNTSKNGPSSVNGVSLACRWWPSIEFWLGSFVIFQVIRTSIAKRP